MSEEVPYGYLRYAESWQRKRASGEMVEGLSFDDVILEPGISVVGSPTEVDTSTTLTDNITLVNGVISSNMDRVTGVDMAVTMAQEGGIGALHRAVSAVEQADMVRQVKEHSRLLIDNPPTIEQDGTIGRVRELMDRHNRGYVVVMGQDGRVSGIVTTRDLRMPGMGNDMQLTSDIFSSREKGLVTAPPDTPIDDARQIMYENRVEKLILMDGEENLAGVITDRDIREMERYPHATKDKKGRLQVLASVGIGPSAEEDAEILVDAGADGIIIDVLHGAVPRSIELTSILRGKLPENVPIIVGNVATRIQTRKLIDAGANVVKVGWGPGGFCTTRVVTGTGAGQLTAVMECAAEAYETGTTIIADGGITKPADAVLSFYGGAAAIMIGTMFVGTDESPGELYVDENGARYKIGRGSASASAAKDFARASGRQNRRRTPQGVDGVRIPYKGSVRGILFDFKDGLQHGIGNVGGVDIETLRRQGILQRQTMSTLAEGRPHAKK